MIDSNLLATLSGTLGTQAEIDRNYADSIAQGPWAAMRLHGRYKVNQKRQDLDKLMENREAFALQAAKGDLEASSLGADRLNEKRQKEYDDALAAGEVELPTETIRRDDPIDWSGMTDEEKMARIRELNPDVQVSDNALSYMLANAGKGQGDNYWWDPSTGRIGKKAYTKQKVDVGKEVNKRLLGEGYEQDENGYFKRVPISEDERRKAWLDAQYGNETADEYEAARQAAFNEAYDEALLKAFGGNEGARDEFLALATDPRMTKYDPRLGRQVLKRDDELYYDLGNYAKYWAPEMAQPYFDRSSDLLGSLQRQYDTMVSNYGSMASDYETKAEHMRSEAHHLQKMVENGQVSEDASADGLVPAESLAQFPGVKTIGQYIAAVRSAEGENRKRGYESLEAKNRLLKIGPLGYMSGLSSQGANSLSTRYFGRNYLPYGGIETNGAVQSAGAMPGQQYNNLQDQADAQREVAAEVAAGGEYARKGLSGNIKGKNLSLKGVNTAMAQAGGVEKQRFNQRVNYEGKEGRGPNQMFSPAIMRPIADAESRSVWMTRMAAALSKAIEGNSVEDNARAGYGPFSTNEGGSSKFDQNKWNNASPAARANLVMAHHKQAGLLPSDPKKRKAFAAKQAWLAGMDEEAAKAFGSKY